MLSLHSVHVQVVARIREHLSLKDQGLSTFTIPGAFLPDAFYNCMGLSDIAEAAHWPPFLRAAADYYHQTYVSTGNLDAGAGLRSFLLGTLTHQVSDISWHSLGVDQGLLMALSHREFNGDTATAHRTLDTGGDMILMLRILRASGDIDWLTQRWTIPSIDIINIYRRMHLDVSRPALEYCMARGVAALGAEVNIARTMYPTYAKKSPLLVDVLESYFMGGIQEMTASTVLCLKNFEQWLDNGPPTDVDAWDICEVFAGRAPLVRDIDSDRAQATVVEDLKEYIDDILPALKISASPDNSETYIEFPEFVLPEHMQKRDQYVFKDILEPGLSLSTTGQPTGVTLSTGMSGSLFGSVFTVGDFRGSNIGPCLAVSAPYEYSDETYKMDGAVYIIPLAEIESMFESSVNSGPSKLFSSEYRIATPSLLSLSRHERFNLTFPRQFGASMAPIYLFNTTLLAISSPGVSTIDIFAGSELLLTITPPIRDSTITYGSRGRKMFGHGLLAHDVDHDGIPDLIVTAPLSDLSGRAREEGEIMILSGRELEIALASGFNTIAMDLVWLSRFVTPKEIAIPDPDDGLSVLHTSAGSTDYQLFGAQIAFSAAPSCTAYVGAPGSRAVFAFDAKTGTPLYGLFSELGSASGYGGGVLLTGNIEGLGEWILVGSPNEAVLDSKNVPRRGRHAPGEFAQSGLCYLYIRRKGSASAKPKLAAYIIADSAGEKFVKFGYAGTMKDGEPNTVYISSPFAGHGEGAVWSFSIEDAVLSLIKRKAAASSTNVFEKFEVFDNITMAMPSENLDNISPSLLSTPIIRLKPVLRGTRLNKQIESWFGNTVLSYADYLFVGMPYFGFGQLGNRERAGDNLNVGGVGVYKL